MDSLHLYIVGGLLALLGVYILVQYNRFVSLRNYIKNSWANIDTELKRRYDLIPNVVSTVKAYAQHEKEVLESVIKWRNRCAENNGSVDSQVKDERVLVGELQKLVALAESYPQLKSDQNFLELQKELVNTEDRIQAARRFFNGNVRDYEDLRESFPTNMIASTFSFSRQSFFEVDEAVKQLPRVKFSRD